MCAHNPSYALAASTQHPQVRNLRPCIKAAVDFVSPESISQVLSRAARLRALGLAARSAAQPAAPGGEEEDEAAAHPADRRHADKLQSQKVLVWGAVRAWRALQLLLWDGGGGDAAAGERAAAAGGAEVQ